MWKKLLAWILITVILIGNGIQVVEAFEQSGNVQMEKIMGEPDQNSLYARSAVLMDADSGRILYEKNGHQAMANASTTKILTCIIALENCDLDSEVTVSMLAASQPKVHLGMREGQKFYLKDLLYGLMLDRMSLSIKNRWFDEEDRAQARQRWRAYQQAGYQIERFDLVLKEGPSA